MKLKKVLAVASAAAVAATMSLGAVGCSNDGGSSVDATPKNTDEYIIPQDYCRTYYEVFVRSFADGNGDGIGDLRGLADNLDYLNDGDDSTTTDLGINGIWMMPINASPSYHKYDVSDYYAIDDEYGTMEDLEYLVAECNKRGIWLQMDLVLNHTSSDHPWFKEAVLEAQKGLEPESSRAMSRYNFALSKTRPNDVHASAWREVPGAPDYWYFANFSTDMPDLKLDNKEVQEEIKKIVDFWLGKGIRSFRLDAVPSAFGRSDVASYSDKNGEFWTWFNDYCHEKGAEVFAKDGDEIGAYCYNVGEVWTSDSNTINQYFGTGMSNFNYSVANSDTSGFGGAVNDGKKAAIFVERMQELQVGAIEADKNAILSNFLSNHDNNRSGEQIFGSKPSKIKRGAGLYLLMPGSPYIYYGEEIGAKGSGRDENKRLAFNWGDKRTVKNPASANYDEKQKLGSVKSQTNDANSVLTYYRNAIKLRNRFPEIGRGAMTAYALNKDGELVVASDISSTLSDDESLYGVNKVNGVIAAYTLKWKDREVLIVHNLGDVKASFKATAFSDYEIVATLKADGGSVSFANGVFNMSGGTVAVLKVKAA
ncbi:MAG: hypothetical protein J1G38_04720 [Clostridiales bacterium]|nr:hypothetical protein [Clostridiales bacterium]